MRLSAMRAVLTCGVWPWPGITIRAPVTFDEQVNKEVCVYACVCTYGGTSNVSNKYASICVCVWYIFQHFW